MAFTCYLAVTSAPSQTLWAVCDPVVEKYLGVTEQSQTESESEVQPEPVHGRDVLLVLVTTGHQ